MGGYFHVLLSSLAKEASPAGPTTLITAVPTHAFRSPSSLQLAQNPAGRLDIGSSQASGPRIHDMYATTIY